MQITIAERLRPFSHTPGTAFLLPGTSLCFHCFPACLRIIDLSQYPARPVSDIPFEIVGPVDNFTVTQDLEKGQLTVSGDTVNGYLRYRVVPTVEAPYFSIIMEKTPNGFGFSHSKVGCLKEMPSTERLSLGNHKAQDWDLIQRRCDLAEIFPLWFRLGQLSPVLGQCTNQGTAALLEDCRHKMDGGVRLELVPAFRKLFLAAFDRGLVPRLVDTQHQGFALSEIAPGQDISALRLLAEGAQLIRRLFLQSDQSVLSVLPALPPEFHCGRLVKMRENAGLLDMEWSKKTIRRMVLKVEDTQEVLFRFQKEIKRFRVRKNENERGCFIDHGQPVTVEAGQTYLFDRFEK